MICAECGQSSKYKCPICRQPYCSVPCCQKHKQKPCSAPPIQHKDDPPETKTNFEFPSDDTVPLDKLKLLEQSSEVKQCLENPHVRKILQILDNSAHPDQLMQDYMVEPIFTEFVDACLKVVQPQNVE
ncbi:hypothetical protein O0L34_g6135 [Tuta absoluta]|nr:hypothetical protein O0L34_g6135 [Tuta absoluta]